MCYPLDDGSTYQDCFDLPETTELTAETVGIFDLDDSLDALQLLQQQVVESRRRDFKLRAGTRMVVRANAPGPNPSAPPSK
jgi:hypothetical protein